MVSRRPVESSGKTLRHADGFFAVEHGAVERDMLGLADIVELFAQARADLDRDLGGVDRGIEALADGEQQLQLLQIGFDRRLHVGILQLAGKLCAVERARAMHLAERGGGRRLMLEALEFLLPAGAELGLHAPLDEGPAHRRRLALQLDQFVGVFRRQRVGNGGEQLRHLHDRALEAAERRRERQRIAGARAAGADQALSGHARGNAADLWCRRGRSAARGRRSGFSRGRSCVLRYLSTPPLERHVHRRASRPHLGGGGRLRACGAHQAHSLLDQAAVGFTHTPRPVLEADADMAAARDRRRDQAAGYRRRGRPPSTARRAPAWSPAAPDAHRGNALPAESRSRTPVRT